MHTPQPPQSPNGAVPPNHNVPVSHTDEHGRVSFDMLNGTKVVVSPDGTVSLDVKHIKSIGLHNIVDVVTHSISTVVGVVSHYIKFHTGAELRFAYNQQGQLIELNFTGVHVSISEDAQLIFSCQPPATPRT